MPELVKRQRGVVSRHEGAAGDHLVPVRTEVAEKCLAKFVARVHSRPVSSIARRTCRRVNPLPDKEARLPGGFAPPGGPRRAETLLASVSGPRLPLFFVRVEQPSHDRGLDPARLEFPPDPKRASAALDARANERLREARVAHQTPVREVLDGALRLRAAVPGAHQLGEQLGARMLPPGEQAERPPARPIRVRVTPWGEGHRPDPSTRRTSSPGASRRAGVRFRGPRAPPVRRDAKGGVPGRRAADSTGPDGPDGSGASQAPTPSAASDARAAADAPRSGIIRARSSDSISPAASGCCFRKLRALSRPCPMRSLP